MKNNPPPIVLNCMEFLEELSTILNVITQLRNTLKDKEEKVNLAELDFSNDQRNLIYAILVKQFNTIIKSMPEDFKEIIEDARTDAFIFYASDLEVKLSLMIAVESKGLTPESYIKLDPNSPNKIGVLLNLDTGDASEFLVGNRPIDSNKLH